MKWLWCVGQVLVRGDKLAANVAYATATIGLRLSSCIWGRLNAVVPYLCPAKTTSRERSFSFLPCLSIQSRLHLASPSPSSLCCDGSSSYRRKSKLGSLKLFSFGAQLFHTNCLVTIFDWLIYMGYITEIVMDCIVMCTV